jgi:Protein of unknown function (DUF3606)
MWIPITERARYRTLLWKIEMAVRASLQRRGPTSSILAALLWIGAQDRAKVAGGQRYEVSYEAKKTAESAPALKKAVKKVGNIRKKVEKRLIRKK